MNDHPRHFSFPSLPLVSRVLDLVCVVTPLVKLVRWLRVPKIYASRSISSSKHINQDYEFYSIIFRFLNNPPFVSKTNSRSEFWRILISPWLEKKKENNLHRHPTVPFLLLPLWSTRAAKKRVSRMGRRRTKHFSLSKNTFLGNHK